MQAKIGIAITTYNRVDLLCNVITAVQTLSRSHFNLIVCDDGSTDGTANLLKSIDIPCITGQNRGVFWNKNRGIYYLMNYTDSDAIILMDDDVMPQIVGWELEWAEAVRRYGHVNNAFYRQEGIKGGCHAVDPGITQSLGGQCMAFSREAQGAVGFMDPRFGRYGHEHTEFTRRALRAGYGGLLWETDRGREEYFFVIDGGIAVVHSPSHIDHDSLAANHLLLEPFRQDPIYRHAWRNDEEMSTLIGEIETCGLSRSGKAVKIPYGFDASLYKKLNKDLANHDDPLGHYVRQGHLENRAILPPDKPVAAHWVNISDHRITTQSSVCEYSIGHDVASDSAGAVNGSFTGRPQFHTANDREPWWMVDLGSTRSIGLIRIYNRIDSDVYQNRFRSFRIEGSSDGFEWFVIVREELSVAPGGLDGNFYEREVAGEPQYRFIKITQQLTEFFHLDQIQIFSRRTPESELTRSEKDEGSDIRFWGLTTATGQQLGQRLSDGRLVSYRIVPQEVTPIHVVTSTRFPDLLLLISPDSANLPMSIRSNGDPDRIIPYFIDIQHDGVVALRNPRSNRYVSVRPVEDDEVVEVISDRTSPQEWEQFHLKEHIAPFKGTLAQFIGQLVHALSQPNFGAIYLVGWIKQSSSGSIAMLFRPLLRMLPATEFESFAKSCLDPVSLVAKTLEVIFIDDPWLSEAIPAMLEWLAHRKSCTNAAAHASCDIMGLPGFPGDQPISYLLSSVMRRFTAPRKRLCILATVRDEGPYLLEWIAYHRSLGVEHFFIYANDLTDKSDRLLQELARAGYVTYVENICQTKGISPQLKAYGHALSYLPEILDFEWTAIIDLDEYITLANTECRTLPEILDSPIFANCGGVALNWQMISPAKTELPIVEPIIARSWRREPALNYHVKTIVRTRQCNWSGPHAPEWTYPEERIVLNPKGVDYRPNKTSASTSFSDMPCYETMWINHYFYKSFPEFVWKFSRNRGDTSANAKSFDPLSHFCEEFARFSIESNTVADRSIERRIPGCIEMLYLLRSTPEIAQAERQVVAEVNRQLTGHLQQVCSATNLPLAATTRALFITEALKALAAGPVFAVVPPA